jgi:hypothetical protein
MLFYGGIALSFISEVTEATLLSLPLCAEKSCLYRPKERGAETLCFNPSPGFLILSEQIQNHGFIFLCLIWKKILCFDSAARNEVTVWYLVKGCFTEALSLQQVRCSFIQEKTRDFWKCKSSTVWRSHLLQVYLSWTIVMAPLMPMGLVAAPQWHRI